MKEVTLTAVNIKEYPNKPMRAYYLGNRVIETKFGDSTIHDFQKKDGSNLSIYGFTNMNNKLLMVPTGVFVEITYLGTEKIKTKYGLKDVHQCSVKYDDQDFIETSRIPKEKESKKITSEQVNTAADDDDLPF